MRPFVSGWDCIQGRIVPEFCFGFLNAFYRTVLLFYGCQVGEACYFAATYGIEDSSVRAVVIEERNCVFLATVLDLVHYKEESGPK